MNASEVALNRAGTGGLVTAAGTVQYGLSHRTDGEGRRAPAQRGDAAGLRCLPLTVLGDARCGGRRGYSCPIVAGPKEVRLSEGSLQESFKPCRASLHGAQLWPTALARKMWSPALTVSTCYKLR